MKPGAIAAAVALLAAASVTPALSGADLPPLIIKHPETESVTVEGDSYMLRLSRSDFFVVNDGEGGVSISCAVSGTSAPVGAGGHSWELGPGAHGVECTATDWAGETSTISYTVTVSVITDLFGSGGDRGAFERVVRLHGAGLETGHVLEAIKYFHMAGMLTFDIEADGNAVAEPTAGAACEDGVGGAEGIGVIGAVHADGGLAHSDAQIKHCLEQMAEGGAFGEIELGI